MASAAARLTSITYLDVSHCTYIGPVALEAIGKHCKHLVKLERNAYLMMILGSSLDGEAFAIAATMPKLKQLSITNTCTSTDGVLKILSSCPDLELLDIRGCREVKLDEPFVKKFSQLRILGPELVDYGPGISAYVAFYPYIRHLFSGLDDIEMIMDFELDLDDPTWLSELLLED
ncbi:hypothetical protein L484_022152 [Morus notabilis]|uniref:Uncharacterized protein n=1 Tax=Morus notabilis TaxID=981085 RepID=W9QDW6_9ROSA|nr:F-box protein FBW2 [Morus notabilis]EXB29480.1 hypothetical protein L484_022152 [Morus notabilis]